MASNTLAESLSLDYEPVVLPGDEKRKRFGQFVVLGEGGFGKVLRGRNRKVEELVVALKLLNTKPEAGDQKPTSETDILREVSAIRRAGAHPNVTALYGYHRAGVKGNERYHVMVLELCEGGELFSLVEERGAIPEHEVRPLFVGVLAGLRHLHAQGIAHRDLKLENIMLAYAPDDASTLVPKIGDLGLVHVFERAADGAGWERKLLTEYRLGTRSYMPPEVMAGAAPYDAFAADAWSLGVCLFALLSGFFPVAEARSSDFRFYRLREQQQTRPHESSVGLIFSFYKRTPASISPALIQLLNRLLRVEPRARCTLDLVAACAWVMTGASAAEVNIGLGALDLNDDDDTEPSTYRHLGALKDAKDEDDASAGYRSLAGLAAAAEPLPPLPDDAAPPPFCRQPASLGRGHDTAGYAGWGSSDALVNDGEDEDETHGDEDEDETHGDED